MRNFDFEFTKRSQLFIRTYNETLSVVAVRVQQSRSTGQRTHALPSISSF
jgi:hypothetical protein